MKKEDNIFIIGVVLMLIGGIISRDLAVFVPLVKLYGVYIVLVGTLLAGVSVGMEHGKREVRFDPEA